MSKTSPQSLLRAVDRFQQSHRPLAFAYGVVKKFGDDQASSLAALVTYYSFLATFPLLLLLVTVLGVVAGGGGAIENDVLHSALAQFPIIGTQLRDNIHGLRSGSPVALTIGVLGLVWGSLGASQAGLYAMAQVWNVPRVDRPGFVPRIARSLLLLAILGVFLGVSTAFTGIATFGGAPPALARFGGIVLSAVSNVVLFSAVFRILTPARVPLRTLLPGAVVGGVGWTLLQSLGGYLVGHELRHASSVYGFFGIVLGLMWWIYLGVELALYAAELNVVRSRHLWPRSIVQPPFTQADRLMLSTYVKEAQRRPEQRLSTGFMGRLRARRGPAGSPEGSPADSPAGGLAEEDVVPAAPADPVSDTS
ncbi:MAG TPA: YihY/virulence factor BrkB family protein [Acidimicrobiales bacterium]|nr:YihY/virulence factor BrkB family protein [Acidimicrobiales bacterium]